MKGKRIHVIITIIALVLCFSVSALASNGSKQATINYRDIKVTMDGIPIDLKDATGATVEPFIIDGTTYLPIRAIADSLDLNVEWDGASSTVMLSEKKKTSNTGGTSDLVPNGEIPCPDMEKTVIYDSEVITITITGIEYNTLYKTYVVKANIQNHSQRKVTYSLSWANVNGYTISALSIGDIFGGMEADADFGLSRDELKLAGIEHIREIQFTFECSDSDLDEQICSATASIMTSDYNASTEEFVFDGIEAYSSDKYKLLVAPNKNPSVRNPLLIYFENNSDYPVSFSYDNIAINNKMVMSFMSGSYVLPHSCRVERMELYYFDNEPDIDTIDSVTLGFDILPRRSDGRFSTADTIEVQPVTIPFY